MAVVYLLSNGQTAFRSTGTEYDLPPSSGSSGFVCATAIPRSPELTASSSIAGKGKTLGDIVSPIVDEEDWECLK